MGIPYFATFIYDYIIQSTEKLKQISLEDQYVIIDANSFMHFMYKMILYEDSKKQMAQRLTGTPFGYDGCWKKFRDTLSVFKDKCSSVDVVFDGVYKTNSHRRHDPSRTNSSCNSDDGRQQQLPALLRHEFINILHELDIGIFVARGEADSTIVRMAREKNAYVVAYDSDYHLYQLPQGFVSLRYLNLKTLTGPSFQMDYVFKRMSVRSVALWATLISNDFVSFEDLQTACPTKSRNDKKGFRDWLGRTRSDADKCQWIITQWTLLRYIQNVGESGAYSHLIQYVSQEHRSQFVQLMQNYINTQEDVSLITRNGNRLPPSLEERFVTNEVDRTLINVLINRELPAPWQNISLMHLRLLLPICHALLRWDHPNEEAADFNPAITYQGEQYYPFQIDNSEDIPLLNDIPYLPRNDQGDCVMYCISYALQSPTVLDLIGVNEDYLLWLSLLKLWIREQQNKMYSPKPILFALIISFLKHMLLDTYDEQERCTQNEQLSSPLLQHSPNKLRRQFPIEMCASLRDTMERHSETISSNESIKLALNEVEQFYDDLTMINQFFRCPLFMPTPCVCISQLTYRLAIFFSTSKNVAADIRFLFQGNQLLADLTEEIEACVCKV